MWNGTITNELITLYKDYERKFDGAWPDGYDELNYEEMSYERFVNYIKKCLERGVEMPDVIL